MIKVFTLQVQAGRMVNILSSFSQESEVRYYLKHRLGAPFNNEYFGKPLRSTFWNLYKVNKFKAALFASFQHYLSDRSFIVVQRPLGKGKADKQVFYKDDWKDFYSFVKY